MGVEFEEYIQGVQDEIRQVCKSLEDLGYDSLMVISTKDGHMELGSSKGMSFIDDNPNYFEEFVQYCNVKSETEEDEMDESENADTKEPPAKVPAVVVTPGNKNESESPKKEEDTTDKDESSMKDANQIDDTDQTDLNPTHSEFMVEINNDLDEYDDGDASGLEEESEIDQTEDHTMDQNEDDSDNQMDGTDKIGKPNRKKKKTAVKKGGRTKSPHLQPNSAGWYECDQCDKKYQSKKTLIIHQRKHTGEAPYICQTCGKAFRCSSFLASHIITHSSSLPYSCDECGRAFARRSCWRKHRNVHTTARPHVCSLCGMAFKDISALRKHTIRHGDERNFSCEVCGKSFYFKYLLTDHSRVHTGVKKFECGICNQKFTTRRSALKHQTKQHPHHVPVVFV